MRHYTSAQEIKIAVIGYGGAFNMGWQHLDQARKAGMTPTAVVEVDAARLAVARKDFPGIETYPSTAAMLRTSKANLAVIVTPHNTHAALALQCLKAGLHVVCEKPLAITTAECDAMIREARKQGVILSTYHNRHWDGCIIEAVRQIVTHNVIGEVTRIEAHMGGYGKPGDWWRSSKRISGGILYDWGVHLLEYSLQILKSDIVEVTGVATTGFWAGQTAWKKDTNEDEATALVRFRNGAYLLLRVTQLDMNTKPGWLEITGTKGTYVMDGGSWETITKEDGVTVRRRGRNPDGKPLAYYKNVADHLVKGTGLVISGEWARRPIHILDLAHQSARKGTALKATYA